MRQLDKTRPPRPLPHVWRGVATGLASALLIMVATFPAVAKSSSDVISLRISNATVIAALREVNMAAGDNVVNFKTQEVEKEPRRVSSTMEDVTVFHAVREILSGTSLRAVDMGSEVLVTPVSATIQQQTVRVVSGIVTDSAGEPLVGASVMLKGTTRGVTTDSRGEYRLRIEGGGEHTLQVSFVGYVTREVAVDSDDVMDIALQHAVVEADEVVITGYQRRTTNQFVGSQAMVTERDLENTGITTPDKALAGKVPGVYVRSASGRPGETAKIQIRGINTLTGTTEPLYVLDGMPLQPGEAGELDGSAPDLNDLMTNGMGNIPPENIKSITILKDATAASIYGARAANGVIVIETKMGQVGQDYISYSGKFGITMAPRNRLDFMNSREKIDFESGIYDDFHRENGGRAIMVLNQRDNGMISPAEAERQLEMLRNTNTDWMDVLYDNGLMQSHNVTLSGGNNRTQYFASTNFQSDQGTLMENRYQAGGINMKVNRFVRENFLVKANVYANLKKNTEGNPAADPFQYATFANPYERPFDDDGSYAEDLTYYDITFNQQALSGNRYDTFNMVREMRENTLTNHYANMRGQLGLEWTIIKGLRYNFDGVVDYTFINNIDEAAPGSYRAWAENWLLPAANATTGLLPEFNRGFLDESSSRTFNYTVRNSLEFTRTVERHFFQAFFASEFGGASFNGFNNYMPIYLRGYRVAGYPNWDDIDLENISLLSLGRLGSTRVNENRSASFIGSAVYSFDDRYVLNANVRYDGVDILGTDNQFSPLWSAGVKWNAHNEKFIERYSDVISRLALSVGFGYRGSINRDVYPFHRYLVGVAMYDNNVTASNFYMGNPSIKWEKKRELNLGLELSLWQGRLNMEARYFDEKVTDLLDQQRLPISVGVTNATINVGQLTNKGFELSMRAEIIRRENLIWEVGGNITSVKNNLANSYEKLAPVTPPTTNGEPRTVNIQGYPLNSWFGWKFSHIDPATGNVIVWARQRDVDEETGTLTGTFTDRQIDASTIESKNLQDNYMPYYLGQRDPKLYGGFNTRVVFRQFEFGANFVMATGNRLLNFRDRASGPSGSTASDLASSRTNRLRVTANRWKQYGDVTDIARFTDLTNNSGSMAAAQWTDRDLDKGDYLKCNEMSLSWRAPRRMLERTGLSTLRVTLVAGNLFTISPYVGIDPELMIPFGYPNTPSYTLSLNVGF